MDKIKLFSPIKNIIAPEILENSFTCCYKAYNPVNRFSRTSFTGYNENILIDNTSFGTNIQVNPTSLLRGNNIEQISFTEIKSFIELFEDILQIDSSLLTLTGFDFNANILTDFKPKVYLNLFRLLPKYDKIIHKGKTGITFKNNCKAFTIYDKLKEQEKNNILIPEKFLGQNVLRMELSVNSKMKQTKGLSTINTMKDLTDIENYNNIINQWEMLFNKIYKQSTPIKLKRIAKPPQMDVADYLLLRGLIDMGMDEYFSMIDTEIDSKTISVKQGKLRKVKAFNVWNDFISYRENRKYDLLNEIGLKVREASLLLRKFE